MSLITVEHLRKEYDNAVPLEDVNLQVNEGDVISIIGPSGTGKSTLLRCLNRLEEPTSGSILFEGENICDPSCDITKVRRQMGMVFQQFNLFDNLNILQNVCAAPKKLLKVPAEQAESEALALLKRVGLANKAQSFPEELSGGQQQRAAIARAIAMRPKLLLLDEPTSALDPTMIGEVLAVIRGLAAEGMTMLIVTHEMRFARNVSTRVFYMDEGGIYEEGSPEQIFEHPEREKTRRFIGQLKTSDLSLDPNDLDYQTVFAGIEAFGSETGLPLQMQRYLMLAFEELVFQCVVPFVRLQGEGHTVSVSFEFGEDEGCITMKVLWGGEAYNPLEGSDELSRAILGKAAREMNWRYTDQNEVTVII